MTSKPGELIFTCLMLVFSCIALLMSYDISGFESISAPGVLPLLASTVLVLSALVIFRNTWVLPKHAADVSFKAQMTPPVLVNFLAFGVAYIGLLSLVGFIVATILYLFVSILYLHRQGWLLAFFVSINSLAAVYIVFRIVFKIILPEGMLGQ